MLWLPLGQHEFLFEHWMKLGTFMVPFLLFIALIYRQHQIQLTQDIRLLSLCMFIIYIAHQFEEHWIDLNGNTYAFQGFLNSTLKSLLSVNDADALLISKADIFMINTSVVWLVACLAIYFASERIFPTLALAGLILVNSISHSLAAIKSLAYNPGLITSIVIFIPFCLWFYNYIFKQKLTKFSLILWSIAWALVAHIILMVGLVLANHYEVLPSIIYYCVLIVWSIIPALIKSKLRID
ncbi:MAG: HXXEE domain-containing protein [Pseudomonadota bacterium]